MLTIDRADRADLLADALAQRLRTPPEDPFTPVAVCVPTRGLERWLSQRLSATLGACDGTPDGVCANVAFPSPARLVADILASASGITPEHDPWPADRLVWPLIEVAEQALGEAWLKPLARHLRADPAQRYPRLIRIARLFERYASYRPELLQAWAAGGRGGIDDDAPGGWQVELWRRVRARLEVPSAPERLASVEAWLKQPPAWANPPAQIILFGITRLPALQLTVIHALARTRDVRLMVLHPSAVAWGGGSPRNRLLASWGRDALALGATLARRQTPSDQPPASVEVHHLPAPTPDRSAATLLAAIQRDIRADQPPPGSPLGDGEQDRRLRLEPSDRSIQIHACHGRARQVEVIREAILHRLQFDPTLELRDVIVMCPDIETFAPMIEASFGLGVECLEPTDTGPPDQPPALRFRLADRSLRRTTPLLGTVAALLELASGRVTATEVLDLVDRSPVRARFVFDDPELARLRGWVAAAEIHWGLDGAGRARYKLGGLTQGTWADGLRRLLLGVALSPGASPQVAGTPAVVEIASSEIELAGRFCELIDRLDAAVRAFSGALTPAAWAAAIATATDELTLTPATESWQREALDELLTELRDAAGATSVELTLRELRTWIGERVEARARRANFGTGALTFCTLAPMRAVPYRIVCLLGLDDRAFPRQRARDGDNLLLADPRPGDRDPRAEDRQLLLDALLAAGDALIITYSGNDERTNAALAPAVPVGELLDAIDATVVPTPAHARDRIVIHHPLQSFDPRNFSDAGPGPAQAGFGPWSFDQAGLLGARASFGPRPPREAFLPEPLALTPAREPLTLDELTSFLQRPVRGFLRERLGISLPQERQELSDALPLTLDPLNAWAVGERLLDALLAGTGGREATLAEAARGTLPPGALASPAITALWPDVRALADVTRSCRGSADARVVAIDLWLAAGVRLTGSVADVHGHVLVSVSYARLHPRRRLGVWLALLALSAAEPETPFSAVALGRGQQPGIAAISVFPQLAPRAAEREQRARALLAEAVEVHARGLSAPLTLPCATAHAYVQALRTGTDPVAAAEGKWRSTFDHRGEDAEPENRLVLGPELDVVALARLAPAIWQPLLDHESVESA